MAPTNCAGSERSRHSDVAAVGGDVDERRRLADPARRAQPELLDDRVVQEVADDGADGGPGEPGDLGQVGARRRPVAVQRAQQQAAVRPSGVLRRRHSICLFSSRTNSVSSHPAVLSFRDRPDRADLRGQNGSPAPRRARASAPRPRRGRCRGRRARDRGGSAPRGRMPPRPARRAARASPLSAATSRSAAPSSRRTSTVTDAGSGRRARPPAPAPGAPAVRPRRARRARLPPAVAAGHPPAGVLAVDDEDVLHRPFEERAVVADDHERARPVVEEVLEHAQRVEVEVVGGLVEQQHVRPGPQREQELQPPPLAAGQQPDRGPLGVGVEPEPLEQAGVLPVGLPGRAGDGLATRIVGSSSMPRWS